MIKLTLEKNTEVILQPHYFQNKYNSNRSKRIIDANYQSKIPISFLEFGELSPGNIEETCLWEFFQIDGGSQQI